jgi:NADH-quinone oxidoreductase subunit K
MFLPISLAKCLLFITIVFSIGLIGIFTARSSIITILMSLEIMLLAINLGFVCCSLAFDDSSGQLFALFILAVAAAESAIGLAIFVVYYRLRGSIFVDTLNLLKG